ncbi:MAG: YigZ family protein [Bacilli bacterium]|nr:YigZ family protein [Bacilli bacterium]
MEVNFDHISHQSEINKSKFIAIYFELNDDTKFKELLDQIKKAHPKAKHYVYAYRVKQKSKSSDDGEPHGTAGRPILEFLYKKGLNNCALVVVRYFGGTKLGASRLLRAYLNSAIEVAKKIEVKNNV